MINAIINGIFNLVLGLVDIILIPIDSAIETFLPGVSTALSYIGQFFNYILQFIPYICSWLHLPTFLIDFVIAYFTFKLTVPLLVHTVKLAISWYDKLKV